MKRELSTLAADPLRAAILVVSDSAAADQALDASGTALRHVLEHEAGGLWTIADSAIVPDKEADIQRTLQNWTDGESRVNLIVVCGGTGFAVKDVTPEAVAPLLHKNAPGIVHGMLAASLRVTPFAIMARPVAGTRHQSVIITVPGSPKAAKENLEAVLKLLPHACALAAGADSRRLHDGGVTTPRTEAGIQEDNGKDDTPFQYWGHICRHARDDLVVPTPHTLQEPDLLSNDPDAGPAGRKRASPYPMISVDEALELISTHMPRRGTQQKSLLEGGARSNIGLLVAEHVTAAECVPAFRTSMVDGYALRVPVQPPSPKGVFPVSSLSFAASSQVRDLPPGELVRMATGAPLPYGANAIVMVEDTRLASKTEDGKEETEVEILTDEVRPGENVREIGSDVITGEVVLPRGSRITATGGELGLLLSVGRRNVVVHLRPKVGLLSTGNELVHPSQDKLEAGKVRDTSKHTLTALLQDMGYECFDLGTARDQPADLNDQLERGMQRCDVLLTTGGVSMGDRDLLKPAIERHLKGVIHFGRLNAKPGKPTTFATVRQHGRTKAIFSLPGNPAAALAMCYVLVVPGLEIASGVAPAVAGLPKLLVLLDEDIVPDPHRPEYHRVRATVRAGRIHARSTGGQRSSRIGSFLGANALLCLEAREAVYRKGDEVEALIIGSLVGEPRNPAASGS